MGKSYKLHLCGMLVDKIEIDGWADLGCLNGCKKCVIHPHAVKSLIAKQPLAEV